MELEISVFINDVDSPSEVFLRQLFETLGRENKINLISIHGTKNKWDRSNFNVIPVSKPYSIRFVIGFFYISFKYWRFNLREVYLLYILSFIKTNKVYFPFLYMLSPFEKVLPMFLSKNKGVSIYTSIRGTEVTIDPFIKGPEIIMSYQSVLLNVHKVHFLSEKLYSQFSELGLKHLEYGIIYQGVNRAKFKYKIVPKDKLRLISIGRLDYIKGFEFLLLTCYHLKLMNIDFECSIVGYGSEKKKLQFLINDLSLQGMVFLIENILHDQLPDIIVRHNTYVHTHLVTGISNTMLEAFSCGLNVFSFYSDFESYRIEKLSDFFKEVPRYDVQGLAAKIAGDWASRFPEIRDVDLVLEKFELDYQSSKFQDFFQ